MLDGGIRGVWVRRATAFVRCSDGAVIGEHDTVSDLVSFVDRRDREADHLNAAIYLHCDAIAHDPSPRIAGALQRRAQIGAQPRRRHRNDIATGRTGGRLQIFSRSRREILNLIGLVDDDVGRSKMLRNSVGRRPQ